MKIGIYGAGSIGAFVGTHIAAHTETEVVFLNSSTRLQDAARASGRMHAKSMKKGVAHVDVQNCTFSTDPSSMADCDAVLVCVKSTLTETVAMSLGRVLNHREKPPVVVSLQNGVNNSNILRQYISDQILVLAGMVGYNVVNEEDLSSLRQTTEGSIHIQQGKGGSLQSSAALATLFAEARLEVVHDADITSTQHGKLLINLFNSVNALSGLPISRCLASRLNRVVWASAIAEGLAVCRAAGITPAQVLKLPTPILQHSLRVPNWAYQLLTRSVAKVDPNARTSMAQDFQNGQFSTEIDYLNGYIVEMGCHFDIPTPVNAAIVRLIKRSEQTRTKPAYSPSELMQLTGTPAPSVMYSVVPLLMMGILGMTGITVVAVLRALL